MFEKKRNPRNENNESNNSTVHHSSNFTDNDDDCDASGFSDNHEMGSCNAHGCHAKVISTNTMGRCPSTPVIPITVSGVIAKIPVVLAEFEVQITSEARIKLEEPAI